MIQTIRALRTIDIGIRIDESRMVDDCTVVSYLLDPNSIIITVIVPFSEGIFTADRKVFLFNLERW